MERHGDGRITIEFDEHLTVTLRRPKLGEYRRLRTRMDEIQQELNAQREALRTENPEISDLELALAVNDHAEKLTVGWWTDVFTYLGDCSELPDPDEWPAYLAYAPTVLAQALAHWRSVPLAPGGK